MLRRSFLASALATAAVIAVQSPAQAGDRPLRVAEIWNITSLDPVTDGTLMKEKALTVETLVKGMPDFSIAPGLAASWERTGPLTWLFQLRPNVTFHDGAPLTAAVAKASLENAIAGNKSVLAYTKIAAIAAKGDLALEITTTEPYPSLPAALEYSSTAIVSPASKKTDKGGIDIPIGTGPYKVTKWDLAAQTFTADRYDGYWGKKPTIPSIEFRAVPDPTTRSLEMQKGNIDFTSEVPYGDLDMLAAKGFNVMRNVTARDYILTFGSLVDTPFADIRVRKALSAAIDREAIAQYVLFGMGRPAVGPFEPNMVFANKTLKPTAFDPAAAKKLLAEAGYTAGANGVLQKDGKPLAFRLFTYPQRPGLVPMAEAIQGQLKKIGVGVEVKVMTYAAIAPEMKPGDARLAAFATTMFPDPDFFLRAMYASDGINNSWGYRNEALDAALKTATTATSDADRAKAYDLVQSLAMADESIILVDYYGVNVVMKKTVGNYTFNPSAHDYMLDSSMTLGD